MNFTMSNVFHFLDDFHQNLIKQLFLIRKERVNCSLANIRNLRYLIHRGCLVSKHGKRLRGCLNDLLSPVNRSHHIPPHFH